MWLSCLHDWCPWWSRNGLPFWSVWVYPRFFGRVRVSGSFVFCVVLCRPLFVIVIFPLTMCVLSVLWFTDSDYPFGIFAIFFHKRYANYFKWSFIFFFFLIKSKLNDINSLKKKIPGLCCRKYVVQNKKSISSVIKTRFGHYCYLWVHVSNKCCYRSERGR